jgi:hypothetical protein
LQGYRLASWAWSTSTLRWVGWVWLWRRSGGVGSQEQQQVAIISQLSRGDAAGPIRVKDEQHAGARSVQQVNQVNH